MSRQSRHTRSESTQSDQQQQQQQQQCSAAAAAGVQLGDGVRLQESEPLVVRSVVQVRVLRRLVQQPAEQRVRSQRVALQALPAAGLCRWRRCATRHEHATRQHSAQSAHRELVADAAVANRSPRATHHRALSSLWPICHTRHHRLVRNQWYFFVNYFLFFTLII